MNQSVSDAQLLNLSAFWASRDFVKATGRSPEADQEMADWLWNQVKDQVELLQKQEKPQVSLSVKTYSNFFSVLEMLAEESGRSERVCARAIGIFSGLHDLGKSWDESWNAALAYMKDIAEQPASQAVSS